MPHAPDPKPPPPTRLPPPPADPRWIEEILAAAQALIEHSRQVRRQSIEVIECSVRLRDRRTDFVPD